MGTSKNFFITMRHCGLDPQSPCNNAFKEMLKQVQHDEKSFLKCPLQ